MAEQQLIDKPGGRTSASPRPAVRRVWSTNPLVVLWGTMVGKKVVMAVTGVILVGFVVAHMLGNLKIFLGEEAIDAYAVFLREMGEPLLPYGALLWTARIVLLSERRAPHRRRRRAHAHELGRPPARVYDTKRSIATTYAALTMRWSGVILALFVVYHLLHLTAGVVGFQPGEFHHLAVYQERGGRLLGLVRVRCSTSWRWPPCACIWTTASGACSRRLGLNNARITPVFRALSRGVAMVVFAGFISVPVAVLAGWIR